MQAYELLVAALLEREGYWVKGSFKVKLTKEDKHKIGRPSSPRWEIDVVAYRPGDRQLLAVECKSYFDSRGVTYEAVAKGSKDDTRYKLFVDENLREVVLGRLVLQLHEDKSIAPDSTVRLCLAAGRIATNADRTSLKTYFDQNGWLLLDETWARDGLRHLAEGGYENSVAAVAAKLLVPSIPSSIGPKFR